MIRRYFSPRIKNIIGILIISMFDVVIIITVFYIAIAARKMIIPLLFTDVPVFSLRWMHYWWIIPVWFVTLLFQGAYTRRFTFWDEVKMLWKTAFYATMIIFAILFIGKKGEFVSRATIVTMFFLSLIVLPVVRIQAKKLLFRLGLMKRKLLIVGAGPSGRLALDAVRNEPNLGYVVTGFVDDVNPAPGYINGIKVHRYIERLDRYIRACGIQDVMIAKPELQRDHLISLVNNLQHKVENTLCIPDMTGMAVLGTELRHFFHYQTFAIEIRNNLARPLNYLMKKLFDFFISTILFILLIIPIMFISIIIKITSRGPAIFRQERIGKKCRPFLCYKFRTMYDDAEERLNNILETDTAAKDEWKKYWKLKNDSRVTRIGKFLRETSLDELPQIFNVLKGEMSLVGPRPYLPRERDFLKEFSDVILSVPPGITGLWQTYGRNEKTYQERLILDSWYVRNWNLWLDIVILLKTIRVVLRREGAH